MKIELWKERPPPAKPEKKSKEASIEDMAMILERVGALIVALRSAFERHSRLISSMRDDEEKNDDDEEHYLSAESLLGSYLQSHSMVNFYFY